ncbi:hypothetical protein JTB14_026931 [Gonioctena quinquepunctata]|nr:hypothetical protein JTB14_026931 [Gonioctena quinquepunctata]
MQETGACIRLPSQKWNGPRQTYLTYNTISERHYRHTPEYCHSVFIPLCRCDSSKSDKVDPNTYSYRERIPPSKWANFPGNTISQSAAKERPLKRAEV